MEDQELTENNLIEQNDNEVYGEIVYTENIRVPHYKEEEK